MLEWKAPHFHYGGLSLRHQRAKKMKAPRWGQFFIFFSLKKILHFNGDTKKSFFEFFFGAINLVPHDNAHWNRTKNVYLATHRKPNTHKKKINAHWNWDCNFKTILFFPQNFRLFNPFLQIFLLKSLDLSKIISRFDTLYILNLFSLWKVILVWQILKPPSIFNVSLHWLSNVQSSVINHHYVL